MIKSIGLIVSVCLTALLISSCSDGTTKSGVDIASSSLAKEQEIAQRESEKINNAGVALNQACSTSQITVGSTTNRTWTKSDCDSTWTGGGAKFFTFTLDGGGPVTINLTASNDPVLTLRSGSRTSGTYITRNDDGGTGLNAKITRTLSSGTYTIEAGHWYYSGLASFSLKVSCNSCSSTTTSSGNAYEGYVNKYGDLLAAFNRVGGSKSNWGKNHYCNYGRREGRTYSGLSASGCSSTTTTTTTTSSGNAYEGYVNKYGDLLAAFNRVGGSKSNWGKNHYCNYGRREGRTYSGLSASGCSSTTTTTANSSASASSFSTTTTANSSTSASNYVSNSHLSDGRGPVRTVSHPGYSGVSYTTIGNSTFGSDGTSYTTIGNSTFGSDGTSYTTIGNSTFGSDGTSYTTIGNSTFGSDGSSSTTIGNSTFGSDGTSCTRIGITTFCN